MLQKIFPNNDVSGKLPSKTDFELIGKKKIKLTTLEHSRNWTVYFIRNFMT